MKCFVFAAILTVVDCQALFFKPQQSLQKLDKAAKLREDRPVVKTVDCPGNSTTHCPDNTTCCKVAESGGYWCCKYPNAQCCNTWCCAEGQTCSSTPGECSSGESLTDLLATTPTEHETFIYKGGEGACDQGSTNCEYSSGETKCCPFSYAVCCSDKIHCCPQGTTCDVSTGKCLRGGYETNWLIKEPARKMEGGNKGNIGYAAKEPAEQARKILQTS